MQKKKRIIILGTPGSGKTTLARKLSEALSLPHVELDALNWKPNWVETEKELFRTKVEGALSAEGWVVDGNYSRTRDIIWGQGEVAIWLDYSLFTILSQVVKRTIQNCTTKEELWPGCRESYRHQLLSRKSIFVFVFKSYWKKKRSYPLAFKQYPHLEVIRITSPKQLALEYDRWFKAADPADTHIG